MCVRKEGERQSKTERQKVRKDREGEGGGRNEGPRERERERKRYSLLYNVKNSILFNLRLNCEIRGQMPLCLTWEFSASSWYFHIPVMPAVSWFSTTSYLPG